MANEKRLIPFGEKVTLYDLPFGAMFAFGDDCIAVKSEYSCNNGLIEAFIINSGELFWGGAKTAKEQNELMVQPLEIVEVEAVEVKHGEWIMVIDENDCECIECPLCGEQFYDGDNDTFDKPYNYCPNCGADMRGDGNG